MLKLKLCVFSYRFFFKVKVKMHASVKKDEFFFIFARNSLNLWKKIRFFVLLVMSFSGWLRHTPSHIFLTWGLCLPLFIKNYLSFPFWQSWFICIISYWFPVCFNGNCMWRIGLSLLFFYYYWACWKCFLIPITFKT